jgi:hypothetical protein
MPDDLLTTTATVLSAVQIWRRPAAGARPLRYVELRLLVEHPYDDSTHEVELTSADQRLYRAGQRIEVAVDARTGVVSLIEAERRLAPADYRFAFVVLIGVVVVVAVIGVVTFLLGVAQGPAPVPAPTSVVRPSPS